MGHLDDVSAAELRRALDRVEGKRPAKRLVAAIAYKNGVSQTELADWFGVERRTVYGWLTRLESGPLPEAAVDDERPGRPRKLDERQRERLRETLRDPPAEAGYGEPTWTPELVRRHVAATFDVEYSLPSCRRLLKDAGLRYRPSHEESDGRTGAWLPPERSRRPGRTGGRIE